MRQLAVVSVFHVGHQILVQQQIAIVLAIGEVIDYKQFAAMRSNCRFPTGIQSIVVHHQPISNRFAQRVPRCLNIVAPVGSKPLSMSQPRLRYLAETTTFSRIAWQRNRVEALLAYQPQ